MKTRLMAASATLAAALAPALTTSAAVPSPAATRALQYLASQQQPDGSLDGALGETADYALGARFHGLDPKTLKASSGKSVYDFLGSWVASSVPCAAVSNTRDGNSIGKLVQAVVAGGLDPTAFGGRNLLADLEGPGATAGGAYDPGTGTFADCASYDAKSGKHQNAVYAEANAILGLEVAGNPTYPVPAAAFQRLRVTQDANGGWATFGSDNSNATAMALMALLQGVPGCDSAVAAGLRFMGTQQDPASGGFTYASSFGTASDPDSDALGIQAIVAAGQDPAGSAWNNGKGTPASDLPTFQDQQSGGFKFDHGASTTPDAFTTSEVPAGLDRAPFPGGSVRAATGTCAVTATPRSDPSPTPSAGPALPRAGAAPSAAPGAERLAFALLGLLAATALMATRPLRRRG